MDDHNHAHRAPWTIRSAFSQAVGIGVLAAMAAFAVWKFHPKAPALFVADTADRALAPADVIERWAGDVQWIDARGQAHFDRGHMPGAIRLGADEIEMLVSEHHETLSAESRPVVIYCGAKKCAASHRVSAYLEDFLWIKAWVVTGGWDALVEAGLTAPVEEDASSTPSWIKPRKSGAAGVAEGKD